MNRPAGNASCLGCLIFAASSLMACAPGTIDEASDPSSEAITDPNGLPPNGLNPNGLNPNGLNPNGLGPNGLPSNGLNPNGLNPNGLNPNGLNPNNLNPYGLGAILLSDKNGGGGPGDLSRALLRKVWLCAFASGDNASYTWYDSYGYYTSSSSGSGSGSGSGGSSSTSSWVYAPSGPHLETLSGSLGLATSWHTSALTTSQKQWISGCVASLVNAYGQQVIVSVRGDNPILLSGVTPSEWTYYPMGEAVFWSPAGATLFDSTHTYYACSFPDNPCASYTSLRICGNKNGVGNCGPIQYVGSCANFAVSGRYVAVPAATAETYAVMDMFKSTATPMINTYLPVVAGNIGCQY